MALLALDDRSLTRDQVAGWLWPDSSQAHATGNLRRTLSVVRRQVPGLVFAVGHRLSLAAGVSVDVRAQRCLIDAITSGEQTTAAPSEVRVLQGSLLPDWDEPWLEASREELRQLRLVSLETLAAANLGAGRPAIALVAALRVAYDEPLRESAHRLVIQAHLAQGNYAEAARQYQRYQAQLWNELRLRPGADLQALMTPLLPESSLAR